MVSSERETLLKNLKEMQNLIDLADVKLIEEGSKTATRVHPEGQERKQRIGDQEYEYLRIAY